MDVLEHIAALACPFPLVNIDRPTVPEPGQHHPTPNLCRKVFAQGECEKFYRSLKHAAERAQCPYGFSVWPIQLGASSMAVTGVIGAPRLGGDSERRRAKEYPENKIASEAVPRWAKGTAAVVAQGVIEREEEFARRLEALHEIRRLNQIVKTNMERACNTASPKDLDAAPADLVRAYRASSLISVQLDALDLLANPASAMSFKPRRWVFFRTVDKMVRIYRVIADGRNVKLRLSGSSIAQALLDERTIHIIPSVFIDNAIKYSEPGGSIEVHVGDEVRDNVPIITLTVTSNGPTSTEGELNNLFVSRTRGVGARAVAEGSGIGLTLAKVVSDQHGGKIFAKQTPGAGDRADWTFTFEVPQQ